jgi:glycerol-3-phosphate dehydrogenase
VGTTDTPVAEATLEPRALDEEIEFILGTAERYLAKPPTRADILSVHAGIRPLVRAREARSTAALSRGHDIHIDASGLLTIAGGKWTTYRNMAEDCVDQAAELAGLPERPCATKHLNIHGYHPAASKFGALAVYGSDAPAIADLARAEAGLDALLHPSLPYSAAEVAWAARFEMARSVEDVLARRTRALFLDAGAAVEMAPRVAELMARELGRDEEWRRREVGAFERLAEGYRAR